MKQMYIYIVFIFLFTNLKADFLGEIKKGFKKTTTETSQGLKTATQETKKGLITGGIETEKGLETAGKKTGQFFEQMGKSEIAPFVTPGKEAKAFKSQKFYGVGGGKTVKKGETASTRIGTGCIVAVKAWIVEPLTVTAQAYEKMTPEQKKNTDIDVVINSYITDNVGIYKFQTKEAAWKNALTKNITFNYNRYVGDWDVYQLTPNDNQCINHDFSVDYDPKTQKINIKKTK